MCVTSGASGEAAIMVRYQSKVAIFRAIVPHGPTRDTIPSFTERNYIDHLAAEKWKKLGLLPSPATDDGRFLRRLSIDLCGRLPSADEARTFLADPAADKRDKAVDRLLQSPDYPAYFALRWGSILRNSPKAGADQAAYAFHNWIKDMIARNRPYDEFVRGVVAASGEWQEAPAINWYWQMRDDQLHQVVADTAQVFLGLRLQCAKCHHHPYERYSQGDYYGLAGFFLRVGRKSFGEPPPYFSSPRNTFNDLDPQTGKVSEPKFLDGDVAKFGPLEDPRHALVDWMARPENPYFSRALVNRLWGHFFGRGLVDPVDDLRETNPPSNPELLDALARDFVEHKFDVKHMIRTLVTSNLYALGSEPTSDNRDDRQNFARFYGRRMIAEVFLDATDQVCGSRSQFSGVASTPGQSICRTRISARTSSTRSTARGAKAAANASARRRVPSARCCCWPTRTRSKTKSPTAMAGSPGCSRPARAMPRSSTNCFWPPFAANRRRRNEPRPSATWPRRAISGNPRSKTCCGPC